MCITGDEHAEDYYPLQQIHWHCISGDDSEDIMSLSAGGRCASLIIDATKVLKVLV